jgi:ABC-type nitrate/sulfonate/bicarbonate transport system ATPase subunit
MTQYYKGDTILKVENVSLELDGKKILQDVNCEIKDILRVDGKKQGQIVGFLGPSGIGKTKFFEILAGILKPDTGKVLINKELKPSKIGDVGVVQQNYPLFNHRTVKSNLELGAAKTITDATERERRITAVLERCNLGLHANHYPAQLSGGQKQRVAIAQQLLCTEHFLLMDEPFSGLDVNMVDEISEMIVEISNKEEENTVIIVSHDIVSTVAISDTIWVMGRSRDEKGNVISGSYIKHSFDLCERGLAWRKDIKRDPDFIKLINEIRDLFSTL